MSLHKFVNAEGLDRFLLTWELRLTPPQLFNDPFEFRQPFPDSDGALSYFQNDPQAVKWAVQRGLVNLATRQGRLVDPNDPGLSLLVDYMLGGDDNFVKIAMQLDDNSERDAYMTNFRNHWCASMAFTIPRLLENISRKWPEIVKQVGVICFSRSPQHLLLWAHYADHHKGAAIQFSEAAPPLSKPPKPDSRSGYGEPLDVQYQDSVPNILYNFPFNILVQIMDSKEYRLSKVERDEINKKLTRLIASTKSLDWAYEQEVRLIMKTVDADRSIVSDGQEVHLLRFPPSSVESITLGCRADTSVCRRVATFLSQRADTKHIRLMQTQLDPRSFRLNVNLWDG